MSIKNKDSREDFIPEIYNTPKYCKYDLCKCLLHVNSKNSYCNEWCKEMDSVTIKKIHKCNKCNNLVGEYVSKNGKRTGVFHKYCDNHTTKK